MRSGAREVKAVVFDYGAVLCRLPTAQQLEEFSAAAKVAPRDRFWKLYLASRAPYDRGSLDARGYWNYFGEQAGTTYSDEEIKRLARLDVAIWRGMDPAMLELAGRVKEAGLRTALLSNMPADLMRAIRAEDDWLHLFEKQYFSCEIGAVKPEPEIFEFVSRDLGVSPEEALLIDDNAENVAAAKRFGMRALRYESFPLLLPQLRAELDGLGEAIRNLKH